MGSSFKIVLDFSKDMRLSKKCEADIPEDRLIYAEVMYDVLILN